MKVCLANDSFPPLLDGVSNTVLNYARIIERDYGSSIVATPEYPGVDDKYPFPVVRYTSVDTTRLVGYRSGYPFSQDAMERLSAFKPDIIHSHCPMASNFLCRELRDITNVPLVFTYHTKFDIDIKRAIKLKLLQEPAIKEVIHSVEACDDVWVVNKGTGENLRELGFRGTYTVMPNGVDIDRTPVSADKLANINEKYKLCDGIPVFLFVGRIMWYKGLRIILDGLKLMRDAGQEFRMFFIGNGDNLDDVKAYAKACGLEEECIFTGAVYDREELKAYYTRADLFLLPSVFDNNPLVVKEAAACGTGSLLIEDSNSADGVFDGENGILIKENAEDLAKKLLAVLNNPRKIKEIGDKAAQTLYVSWETSIARATERYAEVIKNYDSTRKSCHRAKFDGTIKLISMTYFAILEAKLIGEDIRDDFNDGMSYVRDSIEETRVKLLRTRDRIKEFIDKNNR